MDSFEGRVGLVTGGASGIGRAVVERLARDGAGVVVVDLDEKAGKDVAGSAGGTFVRADAGSLEEMSAAVERAIGVHGRLDVVHLNAGVATGESDIGLLSEDAYRRAVRVNVDGVVFGVKACVPAMGPGGAIVATASLAGLVAYPGDPIYGLTKHAVVGFVRAMAEQLGSLGISINALCPGFVNTPIIGPFVEEFRDHGFPLLEPEEVADAFVAVVRSGTSGDVYVCQPGRLCERYEFRGVPGPRAPGAEGMAPPVQPRS